jgi:transcriptional regulator with XRE-family HTH domain
MSTVEHLTTFGGRVQFYRERRGMSQDALGREIGYSGSMISAIERDDRQVHVDALYTFAVALGVSIPALYGGEQSDRYQEGFDKGYNAACHRVMSAVSEVHREREAP